MAPHRANCTTYALLESPSSLAPCSPMTSARVMLFAAAPAAAERGRAWPVTLSRRRVSGLGGRPVATSVSSSATCGSAGTPSAA